MDTDKESTTGSERTIKKLKLTNKSDENVPKKPKGILKEHTELLTYYFTKNYKEKTAFRDGRTKIFFYICMPAVQG